MNTTKKKIRVIEAINPFIQSSFNLEPEKKRVCAYARVSTDEEDQANSFENQINEYSNRINNNPEWIFAGMYADKGITGTQIKRRESFKKMIAHAKEGKIDLILTKSISRFGRNTIEILQTVRELREINVTIYFEKENIYSDDTKLDFILTIMSSVAQEESRSISENIKWSVRKRFKDGKLIFNPTFFLGYKKDKDGNLVIVPKEAKTITHIYDLYLQGFSPYEISKILMKEGLKTGAGKLKWNTNSVKRILTNEKYSGDVILQKTVTLDYLTHRSVINDNHETKYLVENHHEPIIPKDIFNIVQEKIKQDEIIELDKPRNNKYPLTGLVYCSTCMRPMKRHVHGHGRKSEKIVLDCNHAPKHNKSFKCPQKVIDNDIVFSAAKDAIIATLNTKELNEQLIIKLSNLPSLDLNKEKIAKLEDLLNLKIDTLDKFVEKNANTADLDITLYNKEYNNLVNEINTIKADIASLNIEISKGLHNKSRASLIQEFIDKKAPFEEIRLLNSLLKYIIVTPANDLIMISTGSNYNLEDIVTNHEILNNSAVLIQKTHYDIDLNKNITYKLVQLND